MRFDANLAEQHVFDTFTGTGEATLPGLSCSGVGLVSGGTQQIGGAIGRYHPGRRVVHRTPLYAAPATPLRPPLRPQPITGSGSFALPAASAFGEGIVRRPLHVILADDEAVLMILAAQRPLGVARNPQAIHVVYE